MGLGGAREFGLSGPLANHMNSRATLKGEQTPSPKKERGLQVKDCMELYPCTPEHTPLLGPFSESGFRVQCHELHVCTSGSSSPKTLRRKDSTGHPSCADCADPRIVILQLVELKRRRRRARRRPLQSERGALAGSSKGG